ncbi:hypothetical protein CLV86_0316 [Lacinutrix venerupis]|uniref:hypothetical protein n=1 Tax=Lacinutrix venerupis TaxID=1486034 RepID=UPI000EAB8ED1|nr:hypothetical protein [Lacinutrix venerupis]RLJ68927.1 hypothetical protein CLV86_0316 [Lacinutrix venerupis]
MKFLTTLLLLLFVSFASAQENKSLEKKELKSEATNTLAVEKTVVISVKGIKTMEEIDIENYNKASYLKLIASKKQKPKMC